MTEKEPVVGLGGGRYGVREERHALGGRGATVLRAGGQAGELPGGGEFVGDHGRRPVCRWRGVCICRKAGRRTRSGGRRRGCRRKSPSRPNRPSPSQQIRGAVEEGIPTAPVLGDAGYGNDTQFREGVTALSLLYVLGVSSSTTVWKPGEGPLPKKAWSGRGQPPKRLRRDADHRPVSVLALAQRLAEEGVEKRHLARRHQTSTPFAVCFAPCPSGASG